MMIRDNEMNRYENGYLIWTTMGNEMKCNGN